MGAGRGWGVVGLSSCSVGTGLLVVSLIEVGRLVGRVGNGVECGALGLRLSAQVLQSTRTGSRVDKLGGWGAAGAAKAAMAAPRDMGGPAVCGNLGWGS
jgi:hypothetical protein